MNPPSFAKGDHVLLTWNGIQQTGQVALASPNGRSLAIELDIAADYLNVLPLSWDGMQFITLVAGCVVTIERVHNA